MSKEKNKKNPVASSGGGKESNKGGKDGKDESSGDEDEDTESKKLREQLNIKEGSPTNNDLEELAHEIIDVWRQLGRRLLESDESLLVAIDRENPRYSEKAYQMLLKWKGAKGSHATFQVLHDALGHRFVNRRDLAEIFCKVKQD